ncbi:transmembrane protein [Legionella lansingensis]|uniref:Transmembrane protein n=1 Tax=Legionella lansingensis TaxID=45067 RepID=A0A0W0VL84_9GAMM|nr:lysoplasmalogenase [Legionella lansingensis]KTD20895.1 transmembrane protein [Legionella lansingensis]SNV43850.1 transmembrane protein [Legionella lansingensis]
MTGRRSTLTLALFFVSSIVYLGLLPFIHYPINSLIKPIPIALLLVLTWQSFASKETKTLLSVALVFSLLGDIILTVPADLALKAGILSFILAHCAYIALYLRDTQLQIKRWLYFLPVLVFIAINYIYMYPYLGKMTIPATVYLSFLSIMVLTAFQVKQHPRLIISGACLFLLSDFLLALNQFVLVDNKMINFLIMLTYYLAQLLLVYGLSQRQHQTNLAIATLRSDSTRKSSFI